MRTIWKFRLGSGPRGVSEVEMPAGAQVLCVQAQGGEPCVWAVVDQDAARERRVFLTYGTGHQHEAIRGKYVGTYQLLDGALVFHVFEQGRIPG